VKRVLEIAFADKRLRLLCENQGRAERVLGREPADSLRRRLADIRAVATVSELIDDLGIGRAEQDECVFEIGGGLTVRFNANNRQVPSTKPGGIDWTRVSRIKIVQIGVGK